MFERLGRRVIEEYKPSAFSDFFPHDTAHTTQGVNLNVSGPEGNNGESVLACFYFSKGLFKLPACCLLAVKNRARVFLVLLTVYSSYSRHNRRSRRFESVVDVDCDLRTGYCGNTCRLRVSVSMPLDPLSKSAKC